MLEGEWQQQVVDLAAHMGWLTYHTHDSRKSRAGFPDLTLVRNGRLIFAELKRESANPTPAQERWLFELGRVAAGAPFSVETYLWRPSDWTDVERILR